MRVSNNAYAKKDLMVGDSREHCYWVQTRRLTAALLLVWFLVTFVLSYFARSLNFSILGWPFSYYMASQGSLLIYLLIAFLYSRWQRARDIAFRNAEGNDDHSPTQV